MAIGLMVYLNANASYVVVQSMEDYRELTLKRLQRVAAAKLIVLRGMLMYA